MVYSTKQIGNSKYNIAKKFSIIDEIKKNLMLFLGRKRQYLKENDITFQ